MAIRNISFESGYIVIDHGSGPPSKHAIADVLRAADIPALTYSQIASIKALANLLVILLRTLISRGILNENFIENPETGEDEMDLDTLIEAIENMGGSYGDPDLTGSET